MLMMLGLGGPDVRGPAAVLMMLGLDGPDVSGPDDAWSGRA